MSSRSDRQFRAPVWAGAFIGVLAIGAVVLSALAVAHVRPAETAEAAGPIPSFTVPPRAGASPSATPTVAPVVGYERSAERFLSIGSGASWRAVAGACSGSQPLLERSTDGGASWSDVTPRYLGVRQIVSVEAIDDTEAIVVAVVGDGCQTQALRTYTQGQFWESYPGLLEAARFVDPTDAGAVHLTNTTVEAPCQNGRGLRGSAESVALLCDGQAWRWRGTSWTLLPAAGAAAVSVVGPDIVVAHEIEGCDGLTLSRFSSTDSGTASSRVCAPDVATTDPLAIAIDGTETKIWSAVGVISSPIPAGAAQ